MFNRKDRKAQRTAVRLRIRKRVRGTADRPRLAVFKSAGHVYAQLINDESGSTILAASTLSKALRGKVPTSGNIAAAKAVGEAIGELARGKDIVTVVFDRGGFGYHGAIKALADGAREKGLQF